jgi:ABC-2 type transport system ATP-binding protein
VKDLFTEIARTRGLAVLLSTHTLAIADEICTKITIIHKGRIIACDTPDNLKNTIAKSGGNLEQAFLELTGADEMDSLENSLGVRGFSNVLY